MNNEQRTTNSEAAGAALAPIDDQRHELAVLPGGMTPEVFKAQVDREEEMRGILKDYVKRNMVEGHHYLTKLGNVELPKSMLTQEGARNICSLFKLFFGEPQITEERLEGDHFRVRTHIGLFNADGRQISSGDAVCSTRETKYAYRKGNRTCPDCGRDDTIIKGKSQYGGGWVCYEKKGGCSAKFDDNDTRITDQQLGRIDNPDKADVENTVLKMSVKRAKVAAVCDVAMVSEIFAAEGDEPTQNVKRKTENAQGNEAHIPAREVTAKAAAFDHQPFDPQTAMVERAVELAGKLQKNHDVKFEDLKVQFLPEGVGKFSELSEEQAAEIVPGLVELLNARLAK